MKSIRTLFAASLLTVLLLSLCACGGGEQASAPKAESNTETAETASAPAAVDVDLTQLSSTMVYSEVYNIMMAPEDYVGKVIRMNGECVSAYYEPTDATYYSIIIQDATACCAQGIEYVLGSGQPYPEDGGEATVTGRFESYDEEGTTWYHLVDASVNA